MKQHGLTSAIVATLTDGQPHSYAELAANAYRGDLPSKALASIRCAINRLRSNGYTIHATGGGRFTMGAVPVVRSLAQRTRAALARLRANAARASR